LSEELAEGSVQSAQLEVVEGSSGLQAVEGSSGLQAVVSLLVVLEEGQAVG
jgi:hypothetical protein